MREEEIVDIFKAELGYGSHKYTREEVLEAMKAAIEILEHVEYDRIEFLGRD